MALDGYGANYQSAPQGWSPDAKRDIDVNKDGKPNNKEGENRYYDQIRAGQQVNNDIFSNMFANTLDNFIQSDDESLDLIKNASAGNIFNTEYAANLAERMRDSNLAASKDMMMFADNLSSSQKSRDLYERSMYGKDMMGFSANVTNRFANEEFGRGLRALKATGEEGRKNIYAQADATNRGRTVQGEQDRQLERARGDRDVRRADVEGRQTRLTDTNRATEERKTADFDDMLSSRKEDRQSTRANRLARAF